MCEAGKDSGGREKEGGKVFVSLMTLQLLFC